MVLFKDPCALHTCGIHGFLGYRVDLRTARARKQNARDFQLRLFTDRLTVYIVVRPFCVAVANDLAKLFGGPYFNLTFNADGGILLNFAAGLMFLFIYDLSYYWHHRLQHVSVIAWSTHKLHHSDENLGVTTAYKHHWADDTLRTFTILLPMGVLFRLEPATMFWVNYLIAMQSLLIHSNIDLDFGSLNFIRLARRCTVFTIANFSNTKIKISQRCFRYVITCLAHILLPIRAPHQLDSTLERR